MKDPTDRISRRTQQYWYIDGLHEIGFGILCVLLWLYFWAGNYIPSGSLMNALYQSSMILVIVGGALVVNKSVTALKKRMTYPRTGFLEYKKTDIRRQLLYGFIAMLVMFTIVIITTVYTLSLDWMPAFTGLGFGVVLGYLGQRLGIIRFYLIAVISVLLGFGLAAMQLGNVPGMAAVYGFIGLVLLVSGGFTLWRYIQQTGSLNQQS